MTEGNKIDTEEYKNIVEDNSEEIKKEIAFLEANKIIDRLRDENVDPILAMAACGDAWVRLCMAIGYDKEWFDTTCRMLSNYYEANKVEIEKLKEQNDI